MTRRSVHVAAGAALGGLLSLMAAWLVVPPATHRRPSPGSRPPTSRSRRCRRRPRPSRPAGTKPAGPRGSVAATPGVAGVDFADFAYPADSCRLGGDSEAATRESYPVRDGQFTDGLVTVFVDEAQPLGDLTGDGVGETLVVVTCTTGAGSSTHAHPWIFTADAAAPTGTRRLPLPTLHEDLVRARNITPESYLYFSRAVVKGGALTTEWSLGRKIDADAETIAVRHTWSGDAWRTETVPEHPTGNRVACSSVIPQMRYSASRGSALFAVTTLRDLSLS